jgi:hypothetical protein
MATWGEMLLEAQRLGLTIAADEASGEIAGRRLTLKLTMGDRQGQVITVRADLDPPVDLGLTMRERVTASLLSPQAMTGHTDLDAEFAIAGDEPARLRAFFTGPLCEELAALYRATFDLRLRDDGCSVFSTIGFSIPDVGWLDRAVRGAVKIVDLMDDARANLDAPHRLLAHAEALRDLAAARSLGFAPSPLRVWGDLEGRALRLGSRRTGKRKYHLFARAELDGDLGIGLSVRRQGLLDDVSVFLGAQDVLVGDAAFDKRFLIKADPARAERVAGLLDAEVRAALLAMDARCGAVKVSDQAVTVSPIGIGKPPEELRWLVDTLAEVTGQVSRNLIHGGAEVGPYR